MILSTTGLASNFTDNASATIPDIIRVAELALTNANGDRMKQVRVGEQVSIQAVVTNTMDRDQQSVILVEIRDWNGISQYLAWQSINMRANSNYTFETSWLAENSCIRAPAECNTNYQIRSLVFTNFVFPQLLGGVSTLEGIAVLEPTEQGKYSYRLVLDDREYDIEYSIEGSYIRHIVAKMPVSTLSVELGEVNTDTELFLKLGKDLIFVTLTCDYYRSSKGDDYEVFVDSTQTQLTPDSIIEDSKTITFHIKPIEAGTKKIEIVSACPQ